MMERKPGPVRVPVVLLTKDSKDQINLRGGNESQQEHGSKISLLQASSRRNHLKSFQKG